MTDEQTASNGMTGRDVAVLKTQLIVARIALERIMEKGDEGSAETARRALDVIRKADPT